MHHVQSLNRMSFHRGDRHPDGRHAHVQTLNRVSFARIAYVREGWRERVVSLAPHVWPTNPEDYVPFEGWAAGPSTHREKHSERA